MLFAGLNEKELRALADTIAIKKLDKDEILFFDGDPDPNKICTSLYERQNLTIRTYIKKLNRLTFAFSKKLTNLKAALALHF